MSSFHEESYMGKKYLIGRKIIGGKDVMDWGGGLKNQ
jgi:hypothetical protein